MIKYFSILLIGLLFSGGSRFQITEATSQEWFGGLQESGYGTDYKITIKVKAGSDQLKFDELWVGDVHAKVRVLADPTNPAISNFTKGTKISVRAGITTKPGADGKMQIVGGDNLKRPINFKGEGLLGYTYKGRKAYLEIAEFKKLEKIIYP